MLVQFRHNCILYAPVNKTADGNNRLMAFCQLETDTVRYTLLFSF